MEVSREKMLRYLREAEDLPIRKLFMAEKSPYAQTGEFFVTSLGNPRFIMPLTHRKRILFAANGVQQDHVFVPGEVLFCPAYCWSSEVWDREHSMISVVFRKSYIRTLFIHHHAGSNTQDGPDIIYHTQTPLNMAGSYLLQAILNAETDSASQRAMLKALLATVIEAVENAMPARSGKEAFTWDCVREYLEANFHLPISRTSIAKVTHLHPASLSRLVHKMTGCGVNEYLSQLRMKHALQLLETNDLNVGEIAEQCGFAYTGYFIRKFRKYYSDSPSSYREKLRDAHHGKH
jgi:AraC-like DNA-binding protein